MKASEIVKRLNAIINDDNLIDELEKIIEANIDRVLFVLHPLAKFEYKNGVIMVPDRIFNINSKLLKDTLIKVPVYLMIKLHKKYKNMEVNNVNS